MGQDDADFTPQYYRLERHLRTQIKSVLKAGDPIPPESQLAQEFRVSRTTVRRALSRLVFEGLIERHRGRGSFVAEPRLEHTKPLLSFEEEMQARGAKTEVRLLDMRTEPADGKVADKLRLEPGTPVTVLERQRLVDGEVVGYEIRFLPGHIGRELTEEEARRQPLVPAVRRILGRPRAKLELVIGASAADEREAEILGVAVGAPVLVRENTWHVAPEGPVQYGKTIFRGDRYRMAVEFEAAQAEGQG